MSEHPPFDPPRVDAAPAWQRAALPDWASNAAVPKYVALRQGTRPIVLLAPHGGRRRRPIRRGDSVNDLHTAGIAWELAERLGAHAIVNHGLDRNDIDLNRISHLSRRAPDVLALLARAIVAAAEGGDVPLVLFVHGWNMVVPCCDIGIGVRRRAGRLTGRYPTLSRVRYDTTVAAIERELDARGVSAAIGRRYTASGRDNAAQLFSGRHAGHEDAAVAALSALAAQGRVDAAQLELGILLRWPGAMREALLDGLVAALGEDAVLPVRESSPAEKGTAGDDFGAVARAGWRLQVEKRTEPPPRLESGFAFQAVLDRDGHRAVFCGVEATGPRSMAARLSLVSTDGTMMLLVGEGEWNGEEGRYCLEGFTWQTSRDGRHVELTLRAPMIRYPTHDAYLDLEEGLAGSEIVEAEIHLEFDALSESHGRLSGLVRTGDSVVDVDTFAFVDRGRRMGANVEARIRVIASRADGSVASIRSASGPDAVLRRDRVAGTLGFIRAVAGSGVALREAEILAAVPLWRPVADGTLGRWTFGIARCRFDDGAESVGLFDSTEIFQPAVPGAAAY
ncbi:MAG: hypothetical protein ABR587_12570 [Candidatus Binatia bacterium]